MRTVLNWFSSRQNRAELKSAYFTANERVNGSKAMNTARNSNGCERLDGGVALISGGAHGIGRAIASAFQREGACVFILDCDAEQGKATAEELTEQNPNRPVKFIRVDLRNPSEILET